MNPERIIKKGVRIAGAGGLFLSSIISPVDSPKEVTAGPNETIPGYTLLHSDPASEGRTDIVNYLLLPYNGATQEMLKNVAQDILSIPKLYTPPASEAELKRYQSGIRISTTTPQVDLKCTQSSNCDRSAVQNEIRRMGNAHEARVVIRMNDGHDSVIWGSATGSNGQDRPPSIFSHARLAVSPNAWKRESSKQVVLEGVAHEEGHARGGLGHPTEKSLMSHVNPGNTFTGSESQAMRVQFELLPYAYVPRNHDDPNDKTPRHQIMAYGVSSTANQVVQNPNMSIELSLKYPDGATQLHVKGIPANNDGPAVNLITGTTATFKVPAPPEWYGFLPGMSYTLTVRTTSSTNPNITEDDPSWTTFQGWPGRFFDNESAEIKIKTPQRDSSGISAVSPKIGEVVNTSAPTLVWANRDPDVFYYEVQASKDCSFNTDPETAIAAVQWNLIHGGLTKPLNSYKSPSLELGTEYCWRVRPRVQGDGQPVSWSQTFTFSTPATLKSVQ